MVEGVCRGQEKMLSFIMQLPPDVLSVIYSKADARTKGRMRVMDKRTHGNVSRFPVT